jgi:hypothetical protein
MSSGNLGITAGNVVISNGNLGITTGNVLVSNGFANIVGNVICNGVQFQPGTTNFTSAVKFIAGNVTIPTLTGGTPANVGSISFGYTFSTTPYVCATIIAGSAAAETIVLSCKDLSTTQIGTFYVRNTGGTTISNAVANYIAIGGA